MKPRRLIRIIYPNHYISLVEIGIKVKMLCSCVQMTLSCRMLQADVWLVDEKNNESMLVCDDMINLVTQVMFVQV